MTSARTRLVADLKAALPDMRIIAAADPPDRITRPTLLVYQSTVTKSEQFGLGHQNVELAAWLLSGIESTEAAEGQLEGALDELMVALQPINWVHWQSAERLTFGPDEGPQFHGYKLTLTAIRQIGN